MEAERARRLDVGGKPELVEYRAEVEGDPCRADHVRRRAGVEIEHELRRHAGRVDAPAERVELDRRLVCEPDERGAAVDQAEAKVPALAPGRLVHREPRRLPLALVLVPAGAVDAVREPADSQRASV